MERGKNNIKIINSDCLIALKEMPDNYVDSVVTDPPYGINFMNKHWDYDVPKVEVWQEVLRVLKPGGHILCACGTRTQHRMTVNIEDAGFEIRDVIAWIYGSGFPKSLNIGKAIDKINGDEREIVGEKIRGDIQKAKESGSGYLADPANRNNEKQFGYGTEILTKGNSQYEGWGTALKPAMELWTLARKPLEQKTVAENVLKYGTGGINIDGCRVDTGDNLNGGAYSKGEYDTNGKVLELGLKRQEGNYQQPQGRFPANVIHDGSEEVLKNFPDNKGAFAPVKSGQKGFGGEIYGKYAQAGDNGETFYGDGLGSAARFFYCAKASKSERNKGVGEDVQKTIGHNRFDKCSNCGGFILQNQDRPSACHCEVPEREDNHVKGNYHPTVKPISLMQYLCRLITPKNGTVLDPYMGSGSTGIAAKLEGFNFIGIEREEEYCKIADARIKAWEPEVIENKITEFKLDF